MNYNRVSIEERLLIDLTHTIIADKGKETSGHEDIPRVIMVMFYFTYPHSPGECGTDENTIGLIRQYFANTCDLTTIAQGELDNVMDRLSSRTRKCLGLQTPSKVPYGIKLNIELIWLNICCVMHLRVHYATIFAEILSHLD